MPMHDWTKVHAGIFHAFHHGWISEISRDLNRGLQPGAYYALPEQVAAAFGPDRVTQTRNAAETDAEFYRRKKSSVVVRQASGDRIVAMVEVLSPGNKSNRYAFQAFVGKACELLEHRIHLLIIDPFPRGPHDPKGIHGAIWEQVQDDPVQPTPDQPLTLVAYECGLPARAYIEGVGVGLPLPHMPLFLNPGDSAMVPLEPTYQAAFDAMPLRWRNVFEAGGA